METEREKEKQIEREWGQEIERYILGDRKRERDRDIERVGAEDRDIKIGEECGGMERLR